MKTADTAGLVAEFTILYTIGIQLRVKYQNGLLQTIDSLSEISERTELETVRLRDVYYREEAFRQWAGTLTNADGVKVTELAIGGTGAKVAIWCALWKEVFKTNYNVTFADTNAAKKMGIINADTVRLYLAQPDKYPYTNKSLKRYYDTLNELVKLQSAPPKSEFPDEWATDIELKYSNDPQKLMAYWKHLRSCGWETVDTQQGKRKWRKKAKEGGSDVKP